MLDDSNSVVADELLFTSDYEFFKDMKKDEIVKWANCCMDFIYKDIGYKKERILNATIHLDEKTPHLHCVAVPLIKKYDNRSKKDKYHERMINNGYDLDRGIKNSDNKHIDIKQYKKITRKLNVELISKNNKLNKPMGELEQKMSSNKETVFDKEYVKVKKDAFDSMNKVIEQTKQVMELQTKIQKIYNEVDTYAKSYRYLEKENKNMQNEIEYLKLKNKNYTKKTNNLINYIKSIIEATKDFLDNCY